MYKEYRDVTLNGAVEQVSPHAQAHQHDTKVPVVKCCIKLADAGGAGESLLSLQCHSCSAQPLVNTWHAVCAYKPADWDAL